MSYTTVQKLFVRFEVSMAAYVKSFKLHAFDPILLNKGVLIKYLSWGSGGGFL